MGWKAMTPMKQREELVELSGQAEANKSLLCRRFEVSRKTGYKWMRRQGEASEGEWAKDRSRRPLHSPNQTSAEVEAKVLGLRDRHPSWGGRKLKCVLETGGEMKAPSASTITAILRRHGKIPLEATRAHQPMQRFEHERPNDLWQMDFKGKVTTNAGGCEPLVIMDDHSRYALCVRALKTQQEAEVKPALIEVFRLYGLPVRMLMDNGACWGHAESRYTRLSAWLVRLGMKITHGRVYHPQTQGKCERLNRTLKAEALLGRNWADHDGCQNAFDVFRHDYNHIRPHESLGMKTPVTRYRPSMFAYPENLAPIEYEIGDTIRRVGPAGYISLKKARYQVGRAFTGEPVALRESDEDGILAVYFCRQKVAKIDLKKQRCRQC